jgi:MFS family permease
LQVSVNLAIIATGLSLTSTAVWNILVTSSPKEFTGISVGVGAMLFFVGMAIGPALAGLFMQSNISVYGVTSYPAQESYNWIFFTAGLLTIVSLMLSVILRKRMPIQTTDDAVALH